jgi:hypothetical protein
MTTKEIATALNRTEKAVTHRLSEMPATAADSILISTKRPWWSYPDKSLVKVCHEIRAEIQQALKRA